MRRTLFHVVTLLSLSLCVLAAVLWWRSSRGTVDTIIVRAWPSYARGPDVKWVVIRPYDGWVVSLHRKIVPALDAGSPTWRDDVPMSYKRVLPPGTRSPGARPMTAAEHAAYEADVAAAYAQTPVLRWRAGPAPGRPPRQTPPGASLWQRLGFYSFGGGAY